MANFKISMTGTDIGEFDLPVGREMKLVQWGGDASGNRLELVVNPPVSSAELNILPDKLGAASTAFALKGNTAGVSFKVSAFVRGSSPRKRSRI